MSKPMVLLAAMTLMMAGCGGNTVDTFQPSPALVSTPAPTASAAATYRPASTPDPLASVTQTMDDLRATRVIAEINVGGAPNAPDWQAIGFGSVWVANNDHGSIQRIDPASNEVVAEIKLDDHPCDGLAVGARSIWVPACGGGFLYRIDPSTNKISGQIKSAIGAGDGEGLIGADSRSVWLFTDGLGTLARVDPRSDEIIAKIALPVDSSAAVSDGTSVWVTSTSAGTVERVDTKTNRVLVTIPVGSHPRFEAVGLGAIWVLNQGDGTISRIDLATNHVAATINVEVPGDGGCIAVGEGAIWVTMPGYPVIRIDPATNAVTERFAGDGGDCISAGLGSVWLSNHDFGNVWRIRP